MAIRAVLSNESPSPTTKTEDLWIGALSLDGDDGVGITTAAILSFLPTAEPGSWYSLEDFSALIASADWPSNGEQWTALEVYQSGIEGPVPVAIDVRLSDAIRSLCGSAVDLLQSLDSDRIWVRFE